MKIFEIIGEIDTVALKMSYGETWRGLRLTPPFHIEADNRQQAETIARQIIDPLQMCTMNLTINEKADPFEYLDSDLYAAIDALNGDSNDDEHSALFGLAGSVAKLRGLDLYELLEDD